MIASVFFVVASLGAQGDLIPSGPINDVFKASRIVLIAEDHPTVVEQARGIHERFFPEATFLIEDEGPLPDTSDSNVIVYGTLGGSRWIRQHGEQLPFRADGTALWLQERRFEGDHLRVIAALRNPANAERRALVYSALSPSDLANINGVFHGPTEWVVASGREVLGSGSYCVAEPPIEPGDMQRDVDELERIVREAHPGTVDGLPRKMARAFGEVREQIAEPLERTHFWALLQCALALLEDSHTGLGRPAGAPQLSLEIQWLEEGPVLTADAGGLRAGDRLTRIGGRKVGDLLECMETLVPAESEGWVRHRAQSLVRDIRLLEALGCDVGESGTVQVSVERGGRLLAVAVGCAGSMQGSAAWIRTQLYPKRSLAILTLDACRNDATYRETLQSFFDAVRGAGIERVAVDLRRNGGGDSRVIAEFLRYVDVEAYADYSGCVRTSKLSLEQRGGDASVGFVEYGPSSKVNSRLPERQPFDGELFVLVSNATFSSGTWFATVLSDNGLAQVIGEPTGSAPSSFGDALSFTLPASGFQGQISHKRWSRPDPERDPAAALAPDVPISPTRRDIAKGRDPALDYLLRMQ